MTYLYLTDDMANKLKEKKEKKPKVLKKVSAIESMLSSMSTNFEYRNDALTTEEKGWTVDTCCPDDTKTWETGIKPKGNPEWVIVEQYESKEDAALGHKHWVEKMRKNPNRKLKGMFLFSGFLGEDGYGDEDDGDEVED